MTDHVPFIDGDVSAGNRIPAAWLNDLNNLRYGASDGTRGAALLQFILSSTAGVRNAQSKMGEFAHIDDFSPVASTTSDNLTALTKWVNSAVANPGVPHRLGNRQYACSAALPLVNVSGVKLYGSGPSSNHDSGAINCSRIKRIGSAGGTLLTVAPTSGASNQRLDGIVIDGISFDGGGLGAKGLLVKSLRRSYFNVYAEEFTTSNIELDVVSSLVDAKDLQGNIFNIGARDLSAGGACLRLLGIATANVSLNWFPLLDVVHNNATAIVSQNPDNNIYGMVRIFRQPAGAATVSWEWQGGASDGLQTRDERILQLTTTVAAIAKGTGTYTFPAANIQIQNLDTGNGTPVPVVETAASVGGAQITYTPVITASSGTITSYSVVGKWWIDPNDSKNVYIRMAITMTNNGTGAGELLATLPFAAANDGIAGVMGGYEGVSGKSCRGIVQVTLSTLRLTFYDATYPGATNNVVTVSGFYRRT